MQDLSVGKPNNNNNNNNNTKEETFKIELDRSSALETWDLGWLGHHESIRLVFMQLTRDLFAIAKFLFIFVLSAAYDAM